MIWRGSHGNLYDFVAIDGNRYTACARLVAVSVVRDRIVQRVWMGDNEPMVTDQKNKLYEAVVKRLTHAGVFDGVRVDEGALVCVAKDVESEATYRVDPGDDPGRFWVGLYTPDRWLSESIEADLMHVGDKIEELLEEELVDQGIDLSLDVEHFRDEQLRYVFRSSLELPQGVSADDEDTVDLLAGTVLAYEAAFKLLGDMGAEDEL